MSRVQQNDPIRRTVLFHEQDGRCFYCTEPMLLTQPHMTLRPPHQVTLDHLIPFCEGGRRGFHNEVAACNACNNRRGTMPWLLFFCLMELERERRHAFSRAKSSTPDARSLRNILIAGETHGEL